MAADKPIETLEEKMDKAVSIVLSQVMTNHKPVEALQQAEAVLKIVQARAMLFDMRKDPPKK